jgi:hypothetical protein
MVPQAWTDAIAVLLGFALRVAVPIAVTLAAGRWLEKRLAPAEESTDERRTATPWITRTGNVIRVHCWDVKRCESARRAQCSAFKNPELPCWLALQAQGEKLREDCFTCELYKPTDIAV